MPSRLRRWIVRRYMPVRHHGRIAEVLDRLGLLDDDRVPAFETWLQRKLDQVAPGIRSDAEDWIRTLHDGGPRTRPRSPNTVWHYLNAARPNLLSWSERYDHLREVTRDDILAVAESLHGNKRRHTLCVLRSLFRHCKKKGVIFRNPTAGIPVVPDQYHVILPLQDNDIAEAVAAATTPATRLGRRPRRSRHGYRPTADGRHRPGQPTTEDRRPDSPDR